MGSVFHEKVARLVSKRNGKPVLKPNKALILKDRVASRRLQKGDATCITEMSTMMLCWKQNSFAPEPCSKETAAFYECVRKAQAARKNSSEQEQQGGRVPHKQAMTLLHRYPNLHGEI